LRCHICGAWIKPPASCPECSSHEFSRTGIGTQRAEQALAKCFPNARVLRMDADSTSRKHSHDDILSRFRAREADVLIGTQMIAKGHDFPNVTLVGILDADMSMFFSDYRALERTFQLITQVAGRSGRADSKGKVVLQTFNPNNTVLQYAIRYDYQNFYAREIALRKATHFPPYTDIVRIMVESDDEKKAIDTLKGVFFDCKDIYDKYQSSFVYFDKMKSPVKRIKNKYRFQVLLRIKDNKEFIENELYKICDKYLTPSVLVYQEVNPSSMS
jgi:primosomal protein N' (replication factor Y)